MGSPLVEAAHSLDSLVRAHADEAEQMRRLPSAVVEAFREAGLFRMCVPAEYGGPTADPMTMMEAVEVLAVADGSAGWCANIASTTSSMSCFLPPEHARTIYADPFVCTGGAYAPTGTGRAVEGGHLVSGSWQWGSGTQHCQWISGGANFDNGEFHLVFVPVADVEFVDTWYSSGLRGTGSLDFRMNEVFVPEGRSVQPGVSKPQVDSPIAHFPNFNLLACGIAACALGIGRRAVDELIDLAQGKTPLFSSRTLAKSSMAQVDLARAEAAVCSARAFLYDEVSRAWERVLGGDRIDLPTRARVRLACAHAAAESARAVDLMYTQGGGTSVFSAHPLQRCLRDVHTATQHLMVSPRLLETVGKVMLGVEGDTTAL
ncbi:MAG TPA: acyl-CoA dehydrogenase family protein [Acidimicrobiales bacterium]